LRTLLYPPTASAETLCPASERQKISNMAKELEC
jgi:hypothetical protein